MRGARARFGAADGEGQVSPALRAFLAGLIDYAGTFPPAELSLDDALDAYVKHRSGDDAWMLARFIATTTSFAGIESRLDSLTKQGDPLPLVIVGRSDALAPTVADAAAFASRNASRVSWDVLELRLAPADCSDDAFAPHFASLVDGVPAATRVFFELPAPEGDPEGVDWLVSTLAERNLVGSASAAASPRFGLKIRFGGAAPARVPSSEAVAGALAACRDASVPFKATAGLHHPMRGRTSASGQIEHGFVNVFAAGILGRARTLSEKEIVSILEEREPAAFRFDERLTWREHSTGADMIERLRDEAIVSFGSCSFDEPLEGLAEAGLLPARASEGDR